MYYSYPQEVLQEVPGEISLALSISGCPLRCKGCHSTETYKSDFGTELTEVELERLLKNYKHISCVLFYGGEWEISTLVKLFRIIRKRNLKIALYTGFELSFFNEDFLNKLDFIKTGQYKEEFGGLDNIKTNQRFYTIIDNELVDNTRLFR